MRKRLEKEQLALEKKRAAALKTAEREARRAAQPGESHRVCYLIRRCLATRSTIGSY